MLALTLAPDIENRLDHIARLTGRSKADLAQEAIAAHIDDLEDGWVAKERLSRLDRGESDTVSLADVMTRYGLPD
jgi:RHH-type transcriptional regulator, rel operon repressor / antitoxin RelB